MAPQWLAVLWLAGVRGHDYYASFIPNGLKVYRNGQLWRAVGHTSPIMGPERNKFGDDLFDAYADDLLNVPLVWTQAICQLDSDGDGQHNGWELGDPDCVWKPGQTPSRVTDISHPGYDDSKTSAKWTGTLAPTPAPATTTKAPSSCNPSTLSAADGGATTYSCSKALAGGLTLHWTVAGAASRRLGDSAPLVDMALQKSSAGGWLSFGFPKKVGTMTGATVAATVGSAAQLWRLDDYDAGKFTQVGLSDLLVPASAVSMSVLGGSQILRVSGIGFGDLSKVELNYGHQDDCGWPCEHGDGTDNRGGVTINLLTGDASMAPEDDLPRNAAIGGYAGLLVVALASIVARCFGAAGQRKLGFCFLPRCWGWSFTGALAVLAVAAVLVVIAAITTTPGAADSAESDDEPGLAPVLSLGRAAGLALSLPLWFALARLGLEDLLRISKEVAWQIHGTMGLIFVIFGTVHAIVALNNVGFASISADNFQILGFAAMIMFWVSVVPAFLHSVRPGGGLYDIFKMVHFLAPAGYAIACVHMLGVGDGVGNFILAGVNIFALVVYAVQKVIARCRAQRVVVDNVEVLTESTGRHVVIDFLAPNFKYDAGQWARLGVPKVGLVSHPFTVVPGDKQDQVRVIVKVSGPFTSKLATISPMLKGTTVSLEGPYGRPLLAAQPWARAIVFVVGGVGVTPALSLLPAAKASGVQVRLFWTLRSPGLLRVCAPLLERHLLPEHRSINLTTPDGAQVGKPTPAAAFGDAQAPAPLPLQASQGRRDVGAWLRSTGTELKAAGHDDILVFICGPPGLAAAAKRAALEPSSVSAMVHEEVFTFNPDMRCGRAA